MKTTYKCKKPFALCYYALLCIGVVLTLIKWSGAFNSGIVILNAEINSHMTNFTLSMIFYLSVGYAWLLSGVKFRFIILIGVALVAGNFICETLMGFMNTPDIMDAVYGVVGTTVAFAYLLLTKQFGLVPVDLESEQATHE